MNGCVIFVEGTDDKRFVEQIILQRLHQWSQKLVREYAQVDSLSLETIVKGLAKSHLDYFILGDKDASPCISQRKSNLSKRFGGVPEDRVIIVEQTIEAWYLAGLPVENRLGIEVPHDIDSCNKQKFTQVIQPVLSKSRGSVVDIKIQILQEYDWYLALRRSRSLRYLAEKLGIGTVSP